MVSVEKTMALRATMERELAFIADFNQQYDALLSAVQEKKWIDMPAQLRECERISHDVAAIEEKRQLLLDHAYVEASLPSSRHFLEFIGACADDVQPVLKQLYFSLRTEVFRMKCRLRSLEAYSRIRLHLVEEVMMRTQVAPVASNPYMRAGRRAMHDPDSFLFDAVK